MKRPEYCEIAQCPLYTSYCRFDEQFVRMGWLSKTGRERQRARLRTLATQDAAELIRDCEENYSRYPI
ncbi:MAG: hypothetical protein UV59_C0044G0011 [Candidatus Gottesmanbacteria bacterium GW2011_GWA1_43_11]|uniref:Uncharacterized protein n=1 Tax=Candidatus Gottesmanbacteria bacterium GW2011_GWA1_43_11 TaxID=1618436 RepID=A0A0G1F8W4_9BACT|nr:MAG: hypothetical protein UV59_C0044G0011 [Candidatus Gottesmanbacteria bacterium GW2011_GWA1_43_11]